MSFTYTFLRFSSRAYQARPIFAPSFFENHCQLSTSKAITTPCYAIVYFANESNTDVYFDDLTLTHRQLIAQENNYYPFGMDMVGTGYSEDEQQRHKYGYNGKEEIAAFGLGWQDYGARSYDSQLGRWFGIDLFSESYLNMTPYGYAANNPILFIDPDGNRIVVGTQANAQAIVDELNAIYFAKYGVANVFKVTYYEIHTRVRTNPPSSLDPSSWELFNEPEYDSRNDSYYAIEKNEAVDFDWNTDKYTKAMSDLIDIPTKTRLLIVNDNGSVYKKLMSANRTGTSKGLLADYGGGYTLKPWVSGHIVLLSDELGRTTDGNPKSVWTLGGVALHELLYHKHEEAGQNENGNPNTMRRYYGQKTGKAHGAGNRFIRGIREMVKRIKQEKQQKKEQKQQNNNNNTNGSSNDN